MNINELFILATRKKMRFPYKGMVSVEDLWDLTTVDLDSIFKTLNSQAKRAKEESLLSVKTKEEEMLNAQIEIVKYIVSVKLAEIEERNNAIAKKEQNQKIMSIISAKKDEALNNMSIEELEKLLTE